MVEHVDTHHDIPGVKRNAICSTRYVTVVLPDDLPNSTYANLIRGLQGLLHATDLGPRATIHPDPHITDAELNTAFTMAAEYDPWAP